LCVELYPDTAKLDRQLKYADAKGIPRVAIYGPDEVAASNVAQGPVMREPRAAYLTEVATTYVTLKDLRTRSQKMVTQSEVVQIVKQDLTGF